MERHLRLKTKPVGNSIRSGRGEEKYVRRKKQERGEGRRETGIILAHLEAGVDIIG